MERKNPVRKGTNAALSQQTETRALRHELIALARTADKPLLARWALQCAKKVLPIFEKAHPKDKRPRQALETLQLWLKGGCNVTPARKAALAAHAAARKADGQARFVARACGQAVSVAHAKMHAVGAAYYAEKAVPGELKRQYRRLAKLLAVKQ